MVCRGMLLMLDRAGQITLPPVSYVRQLIRWQIESGHEPARIDTTPIEDRLRGLQPLEFRARFGALTQEPLLNSLMEEHLHYLRL